MTYLLNFMTRNDVISDPYPLKHSYVPEEVLNRKAEKAALTNAFSQVTNTTGRNLYLHGSRGTGKTLLAKKTLQSLPDRTPASYIDCRVHDTQYKALKQLYQDVTRDKVEDGHHTSELQRKIRERTSEVDVIIVLDDVDFLLQKDGDGLLYYLSRTSNMNLIVVSANHEKPESVLEERTYSSLHPQRVCVEPYTGEQTYQILLRRAKKALQKQSLHKEALTYIASKTSNITFALTWLREAALNTGKRITENLVQQVQTDAQERYVEHLLRDLTQHHRLVYNSIQELTDEEETIRAGEVYDRYTELVDEEEAVTDRRLSDYIKHLELLNLIQAEYHYGGKKGKTREIQLNSLREM